MASSDLSLQLQYLVQEDPPHQAQFQKVAADQVCSIAQQYSSATVDYRTQAHLSSVPLHLLTRYVINFCIFISFAHVQRSKQIHPQLRQARLISVRAQLMAEHRHLHSSPTTPPPVHHHQFLLAVLRPVRWVLPRMRVSLFNMKLNEWIALLAGRAAVIEVSSLHDDVATKEEFKYSHEVEVKSL